MRQMKKKNQKTKKKKRSSAPKKKKGTSPSPNSSQEKVTRQRPVRNIPKKGSEKKGPGRGSIMEFVGKARQFLRESKMELKKVKWPTRKELLASTAVVIVLTLVMALYFGLVDFGLIKIIKSIVG